MILLKWSRERNEAPTEGEAFGLCPVGPCLKTSLSPKATVGQAGLCDFSHSETTRVITAMEWPRYSRNQGHEFMARVSRVPKKTSATLPQTVSCVKLFGYLTEFFEVRNGMRQGDALACLFFDLALEWASRHTDSNTRGTIFTKTTTRCLCR
ncbi:hypothetical protein TNCV_5118461 [Trichonephila clavipes]|nr:hypothetical protein TNCV_5118461 [Trichonephila clavipes]